MTKAKLVIGGIDSLARETVYKNLTDLFGKEHIELCSFCSLREGNVSVELSVNEFVRKYGQFCSFIAVHADIEEAKLRYSARDSFKYSYQQILDYQRKEIEVLSSYFKNLGISWSSLPLSEWDCILDQARKCMQTPIIINIKANYKSLRRLDKVFCLPEFCVLTGKNGSGKSHLLEVLSKRDISDVSFLKHKLNSIKYIPFNGLSPVVETVCSYSALVNNKKDIWNRISQQRKSFVDSYQRKWSGSIERQSRQDRVAFSVLANVYEIYGRDELLKMTEERFFELFEYSWLDSEEMFTSQMASVFKSYQNRWEDNEYRIFRNEKNGEHNKVYSDEEFVACYGPKPWELINEMLANAGLPYKVNNPEGNSKEVDFNLYFYDEDRKIQLSVNDLSTGEKVLISLAIAIFNANDNGYKLDMLLLDEPDAALHPDFSKILVDALKTSLVEKAGIKVIITTHSPSTVALCDEQSLYQMDKDLGHPVKTTKEASVASLTRDIPNLKVAIESRRQVFVENGNDAEYYEKIMALLNRQFVTRPSFLASSSSKVRTPNCSGVINITNRLRELENDLVYGVIDYDNKNRSEDYVFVLGDGNRYSIENYIFDPIYIAFLLIRTNIVNSQTEGFPFVKYTNIGAVAENKIQGMIDYVSSNLGFDGEKVEYKVQSGKSFFAPKSMFLKRGHDLETMLLNQWPGLNAVVRGHQEEQYFKNCMLDTVIAESPEYLSVDFVDLFEKMK